MKAYDLHHMLRKDIEKLAGNDALKRFKGERMSTFIASATPRGIQAVEWYFDAFYREVDFWDGLEKAKKEKR